MAQVGNAKNAKLNGEWGKHVKCRMKRLTSKYRRIEGKQVIRKELGKVNTDRCISIIRCAA